MTTIRDRQKLCCILTPTSAEWRDYVDQLFEFVIADAVEPLGYRPVRAERIAETGAISPQVIQHLVQDTLVIADLTGQAPQVLYGLAIRHASRRPVIHLVRDGDPSLFEASDIPVVKISIASAREAKRSKQELAAAVEAIERENQPQDTPVSRAIKQQVLEQSESLLDQRAAEMLKMLEAVQGTLAALSDRVAQPENILPAEHLANTIKNSGMLLSRDEIDRMMNDVFAYAEEAKNLINGLPPELSSMSKNLYSTSALLTNAQAPTATTPPDYAQLAARVDQYASTAMHAQNAINDALGKLDGSLAALGVLYRNLTKLTL